METQVDSRWMPEIREVNLSYLMLAQSMVRSDKVHAMFCLGVSEEVADILADLGPGQLLKIASGNMLMCRFRFDDEMVWGLLSEHGRRSPQGVDNNASRLHASIVMAGNFVEAV
ncbi:MAG: flagellar transcriptional regulator FlhD [Burkholderiales bacterium]|jgi:flagellar transcriptional activator FlhD|nr:MAG: flagellar transcriptional regulator FlhD [Burkholderiales bacterium]